MQSARPEGIVSKRKDAPYRSGAKCGWIKVKCAAWKEANRNRGDLFALRFAPLNLRKLTDIGVLVRLCPGPCLLPTDPEAGVGNERVVHVRDVECPTPISRIAFSRHSTKVTRGAGAWETFRPMALRRHHQPQKSVWRSVTTIAQLYESPCASKVPVG